MPPKCTNCAKCGHLAKFCKGRKAIEEEIKGNTEDNVELVEQMQSEKVNSNIGGVEILKDSEEINLDVGSQRQMSLLV